MHSCTPPPARPLGCIDVAPRQPEWQGALALATAPSAYVLPGPPLTMAISGASTAATRASTPARRCWWRRHGRGAAACCPLPESAAGCDVVAGERHRAGRGTWRCGTGCDTGPRSPGQLLPETCCCRGEESAWWCAIFSPHNREGLVCVEGALCTTAWWRVRQPSRSRAAGSVWRVATSMQNANCAALRRLHGFCTLFFYSVLCLLAGGEDGH